MLLIPLLLLFAASGCAALIYEIVWFKLLAQVIGSTGVSLGVLLATYMAGLFIGSFAFPRYFDNKRHPLRVFAAIEASIGVFGIAVVFCLPVLDTFYTTHAGAGFSGLISRTLLAVICLLPPTILMGASLPAISRWMRSSPEGLAAIGYLYGANTAGAFCGCLFAGFYLLRVFDMPTATYVAAAFNFAAALVSYLLSTRVPYQEQLTTLAKPLPAQPATANVRAVYVVTALSGASALGAEIVWTRLLGLMVGATVYTFSIILAGFLLGIGLGGALGAWTARALSSTKFSAARALAVTQFLLIAAILWTAAGVALIIPYLPINNSQQLWAGFSIDIGRVFAAILFPALLWGASFPLALAAAAQPGEDSGSLAGNIYAANTLGAIVGALAFSLWLIPAIGTWECERILIALAAIAGILLLPRGSRLVFGAIAFVIAGTLILATPEIPWQVFAYGREITIAVKDGKPLFVGEGRDASIAVSETSDGVRFYHISGKTEASTEPYDMRVQRMLGHLPAMMTANPRTVLLVGCGAGVTAGTFVVHPEVEKIRICEIEHLVPKTNAVYFARENHNVMKDPRTEIVYDDARHYIQTTTDKFDIITSDPIAPWVRGSASLFTREYFEYCKSHLNPGGVMAEWLPLYETDTASVKSQIATFLQVFPEGTIWSNDINGDGYDALLLGVNGPTTINIDQWQARMDRPDYRGVVRSLGEVGLGSANELLATYAGGGRDITDWLRDAQINTDRNMRLEYLAGAGMRHHMAPEIFDDILSQRTFPRWLFTGSPQRMGLLKISLHGLGRDKDGTMPHAGNPVVVAPPTN